MQPEDNTGLTRRGFLFWALLALAIWFAFGGALPDAEADTFYVSGSGGNDQLVCVVQWSVNDSLNGGWEYSCGVQYRGTWINGAHQTLAATGTFTVISPDGIGGPIGNQPSGEVPYGANYSITVSGSDFNGTFNGTAPAAPTQTKTQSVSTVNTLGVGATFALFDVQTQLYIPGTEQYVPPGGTYTAQAVSNGDDLYIYAATQSLAQFEANSVLGTATYAMVSGVETLVSGGYLQTMGITPVPYGGMTNVPEGAAPQSVQSSTLLQTNPPLLISSSNLPSLAGTVDVAANPISSTSGGGSPGAVILFTPGTATNQTGNTGALSNGTFLQGVNGLAQVEGQGLQKVANELAAGLVVSGGGGGSGSFPSSISVSDFPSSVSISNLASGLSVTFPSSIAISNFPSATVVSNMISTSNIEGLLSSGNGYSAGISNGISGTNVLLRELVSKGGGDTYLDGLISSAIAGNPSGATAASAGAAAGSTLSGDVGSTYDSAPDVSPSGEADASSDFSITMGRSMGGATIDLNPFESGRLGGVISGFRTALAWLILAKFAIWAWSQTKMTVIGAVVTPQAHGNAVVSGTGAQGTALVAAGLLTVATGTLILGLISLLGNNFALGGTVASWFSGAASPFSGFPGKTLWFLDQVFPVGSFAAYLVAKPVYNALEMKLLLIYVSTVRYVVP